MQIDTEHLHHWMRAIRNSNDPMRTMDAFWRGQILSKEWLIDSLKPFVDEPGSVEIHGGWVGVLASMVFQSTIPVKEIYSIDIDPTCESTANEMNQIELEQGRFRAVTADMTEFTMSSNIVINTSCEHITQEKYKFWLDRQSKNSILVLQSNNYEIPEHIRTSLNLEDFKIQCDIDVLWGGTLRLPLYDRFMLIGKCF